MNESFSTDFSDIVQVDGNISISNVETENNESHVRVIIGNRPAPKPKEKRIPVRKTLRRDNRGELSLHLPNMAVYNHRSIWKKLKNFCIEFHELSMGIAFHSEVWEKKESKKHKYKIDEMLEMENIDYISTARPNRRGGGCAITCNNTLFHMKEVKVDNPDNLEVTFATLRPKDENSPQFVVILCALYSPPRSRKKSKLVDFISNTYHHLKSTKYPSAFFALGGDINDLKVELLLNISPMFKQTVSKLTRGEKSLSVIVTDLWNFYQNPEILPPLKPDILGVGMPSDHSVPYAKTYTDRRVMRRKNYSMKIIRPFPDSGICEFGQWVLNEDFSEVKAAPTTTDMVAKLEEVISTKVDAIFPQKSIRVYEGDKEWMDSELRSLRRQKSREYVKNKKSEKFIELNKKFNAMKEENSKNFVETKVEAMKSLSLSKFYKKIKEIGARLGECNKSTFSITSHVEQSLDANQAAEKIAEHFSAISKEYSPLDTQKLPSRVKEKIFHPDVISNCPILEEYQVYEQFKKRGFKASSVPGDIPARLKKEFAPELAGPTCSIFNRVTRSGLYPRQWVTEYVTPIPKINPPENEDDLRNISLTADLSKDYENFLAEWLMPYIENRIDPGQFGGLKGHSTTHYLIKLLDFILSSTDTSNVPKAVMVALIDFSKAFNRINHSKVIVRLSDWGVPGWLLRILISYLTDRSMILRYKGVQSSRHWMPGGSPQGALLGVLLYLVYVSDIGMDLPQISSPVPGETDLTSVPFPPLPAVTESEARLKYVDDLSIGECVRLDTQLSLQPNNGDLFLPPTLLQKRLDDVSIAAQAHDMKLNLTKTKVINFNFTRKYKFRPELAFDGTVLEVVNETKLLGLIISDDCRWDANTKNIVTKGNARLWFLRRLKSLGASKDTLVDIYKLFCRSVLEYAAPVWSGSLSKGNDQDLERIQRNAYKIIFGTAFTDYDECLDVVQEETLSARRDKLCINFAKSCLKVPKFSEWFPQGICTRNKTSYLVPEARTKRYGRSAIPHIARLMNSQM